MTTQPTPASEPAFEPAPTTRPRSPYRVKCVECDRRRDPDKAPVLSATRLGGGNYRSAPRRISSTICVECAEGIAAKGADRGHSLTGGMKWEFSSVRYALERYREEMAGAIAGTEDRDASGDGNNVAG